MNSNLTEEEQKELRRQQHIARIKRIKEGSTARLSYIGTREDVNLDDLIKQQKKEDELPKKQLKFPLKPPKFSWRKYALMLLAFAYCSMNLFRFAKKHEIIVPNLLRIHCILFFSLLSFILFVNPVTSYRSQKRSYREAKLRWERSSK
ncbi:uncharacterized protein MONOS_18338 [Monocercomonoides exilis]|uniref:uncharacterized protein n=1 Tax=Monocercomonoides exilis TaxID=2049356 RepID=UPI0035597573|nr:hypothetical protein MONOS_18338 [Monocercomonoides exilis]